METPLKCEKCEAYEARIAELESIVHKARKSLSESCEAHLATKKEREEALAKCAEIEAKLAEYEKNDTLVEHHFGETNDYK